MNCGDVRRFLSRRRDLEPVAGEIAIDAHLEGCPDCRSFERALVLVGEHISHFAGPAPSPTLTERVMREIRDGGGRIFSLEPLLRWSSAAAAVLLMVTAGAALFVAPPRSARAENGEAFGADGASKLIMTRIARDRCLAVLGEETVR